MTRDNALQTLKAHLPKIESTPMDRIEFNMLSIRIVDSLERQQTNFNRMKFLEELAS